MQKSVSEKSIFKRLAKRRKSKGLSLSDVADALNLTTSCIENLENERFEKMPSGPYISGYLKNYCQLLDIASEPFTKVYQENHASESPVLTFEEPTMHNMKLSSGYQHKKYKTYFGLACAAVVFCFVGILSTQILKTHENELIVDGNEYREVFPSAQLTAVDSDDSRKSPDLMVTTEKNTLPFQSL